MARGYFRKTRFTVYYNNGISSLGAATEAQAVKLAKKYNGYAMENDADRQVYPVERVVDFDPATMTQATGADVARMWKRLWGDLTPDEVRGMMNIYAANNAEGEDELLDLTQEW